MLESCNVYDDAGDCTPHYKVPFKYTWNIQDVDAFSSQVGSVTLYVFDSSGKLVIRKTESGDVLKIPGYAMDVDLTPGRYSMLAWCEGTPSFSPFRHFEIGKDDSSITGLSASLPLDGIEDEMHCDLDIVPLFHGFNAIVDVPDTYGEVLLPTIDLMKDTNILNVSLENIDGTPMSSAAINVYIETDNSEMNWDNSLNGNRMFRHNPWSVTSFSSIRDKDENYARSNDSDLITGLLSEFTIGRLMVDRNPTLVIHRVNDNHDIRFDLIQLLCMVRGHYKGNYTDQQYLDRMDFHELTFFVDSNLNWYTAAGIKINGWKVVSPQDEDI